MIVNKIFRWIVFVVFVIWNTPIWIIFSVLGTSHIWKAVFSAFHKMQKNNNYYD